MTPAKLFSGVHDAWRFAFPPIRNLVLLALLLEYTLTQGVTRIFLAFPLLDWTRLTDEDVQRLIEFYGLKPLLPVFALVVVIVVLYLTQQVFTLLARIVPGWPSYSTGTLMVERMDERSAYRLAARFPGVASVADLLLLIEHPPEKQWAADLQKDSSMEAWNRSYGAAHSLFDTLKVLAGIGLTLFITALFQEPATIRSSRAFWAALLCALLAAIVFARMVYCQEQVTWSKLRVMQRWLGANADDSDSQLSFLNPDLQNEFTDWRKHAGQWWHLQVVRGHYLPWAIRTFINPKRRAFHRWRRAFQARPARGHESVWRRLAFSTQTVSAWRDGSRAIREDDAR